MHRTRNSNNLQWATQHSLLQYSLSHPGESMAILVHPDRVQRPNCWRCCWTRCKCSCSWVNWSSRAVNKLWVKNKIEEIRMNGTLAHRKYRQTISLPEKLRKKEKHGKRKTEKRTGGQGRKTKTHHTTHRLVTAASWMHVSIFTLSNSIITDRWTDKVSLNVSAIKKKDRKGEKGKQRKNDENGMILPSQRV